MSHDPQALTARILSALTPAEMAAFICAAHETQGPKGFDTILKALTSDSRQVLNQVFSAPPAATAAEPVSLEKQRAQWGKYSKAWNQLIAKAQKENSAYWIQEVKWEPPYFDTITFLDDLLEVLEKMAPLRDTAIAHAFKGLPEFPAELAEIYAAIEAGTPDWNSFEDGLDLDSDFTAEVMAWSWARARFQAQSPTAFLEAFYEQYLKLHERYIEFDPMAFVDFFEQLAPDLRVQIFASLEAHRDDWADELEDLHSPWHLLHMSLLKAQQPDAYLEAQVALIAHDWRQGAEVIRLWIERGEPAKAWELVQMCFEALIAQNELGTDWAAETSLLAASLGLKTDADADAVELLELAQVIASRLKLEDLTPVLDIQLQAFDRDAGWEPMLNLLRTRSLTEASRMCLFADWKSLTARHTLWLNAKEEWWLHWLLDAAFEPEALASRERFLKRLGDWLAHPPGASLSEQKPLLLLTSDFLAMSGQKTRFANLAHQVDRYLSLYQGTAAKNDRRRYLKAMLNEDLQQKLLQYWREHARLWVPDPAKVSNGDYHVQASWLKALQELNSEDFAPLLADWKQQHRLRRNLWKALAKVGIK